MGDSKTMEADRVTGEVFRHRFRVADGDLDGNRHANNAVYLRWMNDGQEAFFAHAGLATEWLRDRGAAPVVAETRILYKHPLFGGDDAVLEIWLSEVGRASAWVEFRFLTPEGQVAATGRQRGTFVNPETQKLTCLGPKEHERMRRFLRAEGSGAG